MIFYQISENQMKISGWGRKNSSLRRKQKCKRKGNLQRLQGLKVQDHQRFKEKEGIFQSSLLIPHNKSLNFRAEEMIISEKKETLISIKIDLKENTTKNNKTMELDSREANLREKTSKRSLKKKLQPLLSQLQNLQDLSFLLTQNQTRRLWPKFKIKKLSLSSREK